MLVNGGRSLQLKNASSLWRGAFKHREKYLALLVS